MAKNLEQERSERVWARVNQERPKPRNLTREPPRSEQGRKQWSEQVWARVIQGLAKSRGVTHEKPSSQNENNDLSESGRVLFRDVVNCGVLFQEPAKSENL